MIFSETFAETLARARGCFFTGQPTSPWRDAARTVADRPCKRAELALYLKCGCIEYDGCGPARHDSAVACAETFGENAAGIISRHQFVVADEHDLVIANRETAHAVGLVGHGAAIGHRIP